MEKEFKGFWAWVVKVATPWLTDENMFLAALWIVQYAIDRAIADPEKRRSVVYLARDMVTKVTRLLDQVVVEELR